MKNAQSIFNFSLQNEYMKCTNLDDILPTKVNI